MTSQVSSAIQVESTPSFASMATEKRGMATTAEEPNELQRKRSDMLLAELTKKFPMKAYTSKVRSF